MPQYRFRCKNCGQEEKRFADHQTREITCDYCGGTSKRKLPNLTGPAEVKETIDPFTNAKNRQDQRELIKERNDEYFWTVEAPRLANDPTYSLETKIENGWVWVDDKGQIHVNDKPPSKR